MQMSEGGVAINNKAKGLFALQQGVGVALGRLAIGTA